MLVHNLAKFLDVAMAELRVQQKIIIGFFRECFVITSGSLDSVSLMQKLARSHSERIRPYFDSQILSNTKSLPFPA